MRMRALISYTNAYCAINYLMNYIPITLGNNWLFSKNDATMKNS